MTEAPDRTGCEPTERPDITQYPTAPILQVRWKLPEISDVSNEPSCTNSTFHHFKVGSQKHYLKLMAKLLTEEMFLQVTSNPVV